MCWLELDVLAGESKHYRGNCVVVVVAVVVCVTIPAYDILEQAAIAKIDHRRGNSGTFGAQIVSF